MTSNGGKQVIAEHSAIVARGMGVRRGGRWLLRPVTFGVTEGVVGFAGPPGVGKSTLLATFATLRRHNSGVLHILGHDITNTADLRAARARIGYLPTDESYDRHTQAADGCPIVQGYAQRTIVDGLANLITTSLQDVPA